MNADLDGSNGSDKIRVKTESRSSSLAICLIRLIRRIRVHPCSIPADASLRRPVPVDAGVVGSAAHGHDVDAAVAVEVGRGEVLHRDAPLVDQETLPLRAGRVGGLVDAHAALLAGLVAEVVAHADDQLVLPVAIEVGTPD